MIRSFVPLVTFGLGLAVGSAVAASAGGPPDARSANARAVSGIGGVFFKAEDPEALRAWYAEHLGIEAGVQGADFRWREADDPGRLGRTVWSVFPRDTDYFGTPDQDFMINYRVEDLDTLLDRLREQGVRQVGETERYEYGSFAWIVDGEGNRIELWEPTGES